MSEVYEHEEKGGRYELLGISTGAGTSREEVRAVYRDTVAGRLFHRTPADWGDRMRAVDGESLQPAMNATLTRMRAAGLSIDGENQYKADLCDAITGALAFGKQCANPPPDGHWMEHFWDIGRAEGIEREVAAIRLADYQQAHREATDELDDLRPHLELNSYAVVAAFRWLIDNQTRLHDSRGCVLGESCSCGLSNLLTLLHGTKNGELEMVDGEPLSLFRDEGADS